MYYAEENGEYYLMQVILYQVVICVLNLHSTSFVHINLSICCVVSSWLCTCKQH